MNYKEHCDFMKEVNTVLTKNSIVNFQRKKTSKKF